MTKIEFIAKHCQRSKPEESMADLDSVIQHEAQEREREAEEARATVERRRKEVIEAAKWRTWTTADGKYEVDAKFGSVAGGRMRLTKRDGSTIEVDLDLLCEDDRQWVRGKGWEVDAAELLRSTEQNDIDRITDDQR